MSKMSENEKMIYEKAKKTLVAQTSNFCINEFDERKISNSIEKEKNETMNGESRKQSPLAMTDRLSRDASKSKEIHHPFASILMAMLNNRELQNLLAMKFLDCILSEAESHAIGGLHDNNVPGKSNSRFFKRGKRMSDFKQGNDRKPSVIRHHKNYLKKYNRNMRMAELSRKVKRKTPFDKQLNSDTSSNENAFDAQKILEEYNARYTQDIKTSKEKNFEVFCQGNHFDSTSSSENINQTMDNILESLERYMEKVFQYLTNEKQI